MDKDFWSWLAGFWEGEGTVGIYVDKSSPEHSPKKVVFQVSQSDRKPLDYIAEQLEINDAIRVRMNRPIDTDKRGVRRTKPCYILQIQSREKVAEILRNILPHLRFRQEYVKETAYKIVKAISETKCKMWKPEEDELLKRNYGIMSIKEVAKSLNRTKYSIYSRAKRLRIKSPRSGWAQYWYFRASRKGA